MASKREGKSKRSNKKQKSQEISEFIDQKRPAIDLALTKVKGSEGVAYNARFFYVLANFHDDWVLLEFDLLFKQKFTMYNAMELASHFAFFDFKFTPYDHDQGLVYDEERIVKVELDHEERKLNVISEFILPQDPESGLVFHIHTVLILQNDTVFIYTTRQNNHISQRLYLQKWDDLEERLNMCKIGIRDASDSLLFVSGQFVEDKKLCIVQMQDKHRQYGQITPLSLYWDTDGPVGPTKFEKVECEDGKPFVTTIGRGQPGSRKQFTGAWHEQFFTMIFSRPTPGGKRWNTFGFVFEAQIKLWKPIVLPTFLKGSFDPLRSFQNGGNNSNAPMLCFFKKENKTFPHQTFRIPIKRPEKLKTLAQIETSKRGIYDIREKVEVYSLKVAMEKKISEEHKRKAADHRKRASEHAKKSKDLERDYKRMKRRDIGSSIVPDQMNAFSVFDM